MADTLPPKFDSQPAPQPVQVNPGSPNVQGSRRPVGEVAAQMPEGL